MALSTDSRLHCLLIYVNLSLLMYVGIIGIVY